MPGRTVTTRTLAALIISVALWLAPACSEADDRPAAATPATRRTATTTAAAAKPFKVRVPGSTVDIEMLPVPAGVLAVPGPDGRVERRPVAAFYMAKTELTWEQWDPWYLFLDLPEQQRRSFPVADAKSRPSRQYMPMDHGFGHEGFPVMNQHWHTADMYCRWLSAKTGRTFRLPTEAEWEYAARAGGPAKKLSAEELKRVAWFDGNSPDEKTSAVAKLAPNAWGFYDLLGNVGEWVLMADGTAVVAGGAYTDPAEKVQVTARAYFEKSWDKSDDMDPPSQWWLYDAPFAGFRVVCDP